MEFTDMKKPFISARHAYVLAITLLGLGVIGWAIFQIDNISIANPQLLIGLILLNGIAQVAVVSTKHRGIASGTSQAVNLASVVIFGLEYGVIVAALASLSLAAIRTVHREKPWKGSFEQISFNTGMEALALFGGGLVLTALREQFGTQSLFFTTLTWFSGAVVFDLINRSTLSGIIYITRKVRPLDFFREGAWSLPINIAVGMVGGYLLTESIAALGWQGILLFVLPLMLSAYSLRMYIKETDRQMEVVLDRTAQLSEANTRLEQLAEEKDRMLAVLSHDMRTSLSALQASAEMLQMGNGALDDHRREKLFNVILKSGSNMTSMLENMLSIEQTGHGPLDLTVDAFDIGESVQNVVSTLEVLADEKNIDLKYSTGEVPIIMSADRTMLRHVVLNLVSNAIKYTPAGGEVEVAVHAQPHCVLLEVKDSGYGIPNQEISRIFDPYYRGNSHETLVEGTGLGLAIVKRFVEAHDGSIDVASKVDEGSRFLVRLPYKKTGARPAAMAPAIA